MNCYFRVFLLLSLSLPMLSLAQLDSTKTYRLTLSDGSEVLGVIIEENESEIVFVTRSDVTMTIARTKVTSIEEVKGNWSKGTFYPEDPNQTRLFFTATGRTLPKGSGYFSIYEVFFPMLAFGITDYFTMSGGFSLIPGADDQLIYLAPKARILHTDEFDFSTGVLYATVVGERFGIAYGVGTFQKPGFAITGGMGFGFFDDEFSKKPVVTLGLEAQVSRRMKLISENWFVPAEEGFLFSFGLRFYGESLAADFGLIRPSDAGGGFPFLPWIGFAVNF